MNKSAEKDVGADALAYISDYFLRKVSQKKKNYNFKAPESR